MNEVIEFIDKKTPIITTELNDLKKGLFGMKEGIRYDAICAHIALLEMRLNDLEAIKKMLTN